MKNKSHQISSGVNHFALTTKIHCPPKSLIFTANYGNAGGQHTKGEPFLLELRNNFWRSDGTQPLPGRI